MSEAALSCLEDFSSRHVGHVALKSFHPLLQFSLSLNHKSWVVNGARHPKVSAFQLFVYLGSSSEKDPFTHGLRSTTNKLTLINLKSFSTAKETIK